MVFFVVLYDFLVDWKQTGSTLEVEWKRSGKRLETD